MSFSFYLIYMKHCNFLGLSNGKETSIRSNKDETKEMNELINVNRILKGNSISLVFEWINL